MAKPKRTAKYPIASLLWALGALVCSILMTGCRGEEGKAWSRIEGRYDLSELDAFLRRYPNSGYREEAFAERGEAIWRRAEADQTVFHYLLYARQYPQGEHYAVCFERVSAIPMDPFGPDELLRRPFMGELQSDTALQLARLEFRSVEPRGDTLLFTCVLNFAQVRNTLAGYILRSDNSVRFERSLDLPGMVVQTPGRLYRRKGALLLESTDPGQYWRLAQ